MVTHVCPSWQLERHPVVQSLCLLPNCAVDGCWVRFHAPLVVAVVGCCCLPVGAFDRHHCYCWVENLLLEKVAALNIVPQIDIHIQ